MKTLEVDEFKYVREAFPIAHEFQLMPTWIAQPDLMNLDFA